MTRPPGSQPPGSQPPGASHPLTDPAFVAGLRPIPSGPLSAGDRRPAEDIVGEDPTGRPIEVRLGTMAAPALLCFLHIRCDGCDEFWSGLGEGRASGQLEAVSVVAVTKGAGSVDRDEVARAAAGATGVPVVMSDDAWADYRVTGYPFFVLVDPIRRTVVGETVGFGWPDVHSMVRAAGY
jgi:hypothetical protein